MRIIHWVRGEVKITYPSRVPRVTGKAILSWSDIQCDSGLHPYHSPCGWYRGEKEEDRKKKWKSSRDLPALENVEAARCMTRSARDVETEAQSSGCLSLPNKHIYD